MCCKCVMSRQGPVVTKNISTNEDCSNSVKNHGGWGRQGDQASRPKRRNVENRVKGGKSELPYDLNAEMALQRVQSRIKKSVRTWTSGRSRIPHRTGLPSPAARCRLSHAHCYLFDIELIFLESDRDLTTNGVLRTL
jgi:hypothetical protein